MLELAERLSAEDLTREEISKERGKFVKEHIGRTRFGMFFTEFEKDKLAAGDSSWAIENSPYVGMNGKGGILNDSEDSFDEKAEDERVIAVMEERCGPM
jgi:hypothetical protein